MATKVMLKHEASGLVRDGYHGFSWTYFFFGYWVPLLRGEIKIAVLHLFLFMCTLGLWQLIAAFLYNKQYTTRMLENGYVLADTEMAMQQARAKLGMSA